MTNKNIRPITEFEKSEILRSWKIVDNNLVWARNGAANVKIEDQVGKSILKSGHANVFLQINGKPQGYVLARIVWFLNTGEYPLLEVDHMDRNPSNNAFNNLRLASRSQNCSNRGVNHNKNGVKGIWRRYGDTGNWVVQVWVNRKAITKAGFKTLEEAIAYRQEKIVELHGNFACA